MASPVRSSGQLPPRSLRFGKEASTAKGSTSRLTPVQLAKVAREECEKLMGSVSSVYSPAELKRAKQMKAREYEARPDQLPPDDPQRPPLPANNAPLEDFHRLRLLDGLEGVLNKDRGKIDAWLNRLQTKERQEQLSDLDEWFENFREREPELAKFLRDCESEVEQGRILCQRSENLVNKLSEDAVHTRHEVEAFVGRKLKPMAGAGEGGMVHAVERKRRLAQIHHDEAHLAKRVLDEMMQEREEALVQAKKDFYDQRLSRMRMQQAEQDEIQQLQSNIDERQEELTKLNEDVEQKAQVVRDMDSFVKFARKCLKDGRPIESKDPELDQLVEKYRDYALNRKRHIRTVACKRIDELEKQTQENRAAIAILNDGTIEANAEATTKENVVELVSHKQTAAKDVSQPADHGDRLQDDSRKQQSKMRNELIQTMKNIQFERGRADHAAKQTKVIQEATRNCESARAAVRRQLRRGIAKIMQSLHEEEQKLRPLVSMPQLLPSTWHTQLQHEWLREVKPFAELYAYMMFSSRLAPLQDEKDEGGRKGRKTVGKAEFASKIAADAEAIGRDLISLERKLTPAGVAAEQADLLAEAGLDDLDEPWLEEEQANKQRLASLRSMQQEMFEQARQVAIDLTPDAYLLEGINITEILGKDSNRSPRRNLVKKASTKRLM